MLCIFSVYLVYLAPVSLVTKHAPDEVFTVCAEGGLVEECADERVAIVIINLLMNCILSLHLSSDKVSILTHPSALLHFPSYLYHDRVICFLRLLLMVIIIMAHGQHLEAELTIWPEFLREHSSLAAIVLDSLLNAEHRHLTYGQHLGL